MNVLIVVGSREGGTREIADAVAEELAAVGHSVEVVSAHEAGPPVGCDAVVLAGSLYMWHWAGGMAKWVRRYQEGLGQLPVWALSSGPLDDSASKAELPAPPAVQRLLDRIGCREHHTVGGRILAGSDAASRGMSVGDWRDFHEIRAWARDVGREIAARPPLAVDVRFAARSAVRRALLALTSFTGVTALAGGAMLIVAREGSPDFAPLSLLDDSPFTSFLVPGLLLFFFVGVSSSVAAVMTHRRSLWYEPVAAAAGISLVTWIGVQMTMIQFDPLQILYLVIGLLTATLATGLWATRPRPHTRTAVGRDPSVVSA